MVDIEKEFEDHVPLALKACEFLTKSTDPFLAVKSCSDELDAAGFIKLSKREPFGGKLVPGEKKWWTLPANYVCVILSKTFLILLYI